MEKIKHIEITNFKSIKHLEINDCNKINVFIGKPNAGKSNILEALSVFGINNDKFFFLRDFVRYKEAADLFYEGNYLRDTASVKVDQFLYSFIYSNGLQFIKSNLVEKKDRIYEIDKKGMGIDKLHKNNIISNIKNPQYFDFLTKKYIFNKDYRNSAKANISFLNYPFGTNLSQIISLNPKLRNEVNEFFHQNNLKLLIDKGSNELRIFKEYNDGTVFTLPYEMIADTLQRLIFYKAAIISNNNSILLFEEPEAHCFEPYILEFTNAVKYDENDNQFFIVTHSDYIIKEFLRDEESKENTNIYLVNNVDGETKVKLLDKKKNEDVFEFGMNIFFNFESLWETN